MNQMFCGNARIMLFNPDSQAPGPVGHPETRFTLSDGTVETHDIPETLKMQWMIDNGYLDWEMGEWLKTITQADIGNTVTSIGAAAFDHCRSLTRVMIPDSVTSIGGEAFFSCSGLTSITIPDSVKSIGFGAFEGCSGLTSVTIPDSVTSIGDFAFSSSSLTSVTIVANGGNAESVKQMMIDIGVDENITWNMPS